MFNYWISYCATCKCKSNNKVTIARWWFSISFRAPTDLQQHQRAGVLVDMLSPGNRRPVQLLSKLPQLAAPSYSWYASPPWMQQVLHRITSLKYKPYSSQNKVWADKKKCYHDCKCIMLLEPQAIITHYMPMTWALYLEKRKTVVELFCLTNRQRRCKADS